MYQRFLFFGGSKHGERFSVREQDTSLVVYPPGGFLAGEDDVRPPGAAEKELYRKQEWYIDGKPEFVFVLASLIGENSGNGRPPG